MPTGTSSMNLAGRNVLITSLMVCCGFVVCWTPNAILFILNFVGGSVNFSGWFYQFSVVLVFASSCINPLFFFFFFFFFFFSSPLCSRCCNVENPLSDVHRDHHRLLDLSRT